MRRCSFCKEEIKPGTFHAPGTIRTWTGLVNMCCEALLPSGGLVGIDNTFQKIYCDGCGYCQEHCECSPNGTPSPCSGKIVGSCKKCVPPAPGPVIPVTTPFTSDRNPVSHTAPQPPSIPNDRRPVTELVIEDLNERMAHGIQKYKTALQPFNGRNALIDAYQECLDQALYLKQRLIEEEEGRHQIITIAHHYVNGKGNHVRVCTCGWAARFDSPEVIDEICQRHMRLVHKT